MAYKNMGAYCAYSNGHSTLYCKVGMYGVMGHKQMGVLTVLTPLLACVGRILLMKVSVPFLYS